MDGLIGMLIQFYSHHASCSVPIIHQCSRNLSWVTSIELVVFSFCQVHLIIVETRIFLSTVFRYVGCFWNWLDGSILLTLLSPGNSPENFIFISDLSCSVMDLLCDDTSRCYVFIVQCTVLYHFAHCCDWL